MFQLLLFEKGRQRYLTSTKRKGIVIGFLHTSVIPDSTLFLSVRTKESRGVRISRPATVMRRLADVPRRREVTASTGQARGRARHGVSLYFHARHTGRIEKINANATRVISFFTKTREVSRSYDTVLYPMIRIYACIRTFVLITTNTHRNREAAAASCSARHCSPALLETAPSSPAFRVFHFCSGSTAWTMAKARETDRASIGCDSTNTRTALDTNESQRSRAITRVRILHSPTRNYRKLLCTPAATAWPGAIVTRETARGGDKGSDWRRNDVCSATEMEYWKGKIASG